MKWIVGNEYNNLKMFALSIDFAARQKLYFKNPRPNPISRNISFPEAVSDELTLHAVAKWPVWQEILSLRVVAATKRPCHIVS